MESRTPGQRLTLFGTCYPHKKQDFIELRVSQKGVSWCSFSLAVDVLDAAGNTVKEPDSRYNVKEWFTVKAFGALAETIAESYGKSDKVFAYGKYEIDDWEDRGGTSRTSHVVLAYEVGKTDTVPENLVVTKGERQTAGHQTAGEAPF